MNYIILSEKKWNKDLKDKLETLFPEHTWYYISSKQDFSTERLEEIKPSKIFIPHWSYIIPKSIFGNAVQRNARNVADIGGKRMGDGSVVGDFVVNLVADDAEVVVLCKISSYEVTKIQKYQH